MTRTGHSSSDLACALIAGASGLAIGWLDLQTTEVIVTIVPLLAMGLILGAWQSKAAWRWAALIALGQPLIAGAAKLTGMPTAEPVHVDPRITLVVLAFALLGAYAGALVRRAARALVGGADTPRF